MSMCNNTELILDKLNRGFININTSNKITSINKTALDMTGMLTDKTISHPSGKINIGDIVIIADNKLGEDDGGLQTEDLKKLNIYNEDILPGDCILAIGSYESEEKPIYKYFREHSLEPNILLEGIYLDIKIKVSINFDDHKMTIEVDNKEYIMDYQNSIGHMVIIDRNKKNIKFIQSSGYTIRKETIKDLLDGMPYLEKPIKEEVIHNRILNMDYRHLFEEEEFIETINALFMGEIQEIKNETFELNKRMFLCNLIPYYIGAKEENKISGIYLILQSSEELRNVIFNRSEILNKIEKFYGRSLEESKKRTSFHSKFIGNSIVSKKIRYLSRKAADKNFPVLLTGESGTGKSMLAREIHMLSGNEKPLVEVRCNAISSNLFESELFGYVKGAFTGANREGKKGYFEEANGGTIFLDEIGEIPLDIQVKLLQALEDKVIYRVGSSKPIHIDVRIILATNKNLEKAVEEKTFRKDLYYRINVFPIEIPELKYREGDVVELSELFLKEVCKEYNIKTKKFSNEAMNEILAFEWPGNVRQLKNRIERAVVLCESNLIYPEHLGLYDSYKNLNLNQMLEIEELNIINRYIAKNHGDKVKTAYELGISKSTLYSKLKKSNTGLKKS